jgi:glutathione S-transferase
MLTLHDYLPSLNGWKVRVLLGRLGVAYESKPVAIFSGASRTPDFLNLNPVGAIPALELEDGRALAESNAILVFLATGTRFLPAERYAEAKVMQWLFFEQYYIEPTIGTLRFWTLTGRLERNAGGMVDSRRDSGARALSALERVLQSARFLVDDRLTIADIAVYAYGHRAEEAGFVLESYPAVRGWIERVANLIGPGYPVYPYGPEAQLSSPPVTQPGTAGSRAP